MPSNVFFLAIETFETRRAIVSTTETLDEKIEDTVWENLMKKWFAPQESGDTEFDTIEEKWDNTFLLKDYTTGWSDIVIAPKPAMFTSESNSLVAYVLDFLIDDDSITINPDIVNDGDGLIKKLNGGLLDDENNQTGLSWTIISDDGTVLKDVIDGEEVTEEEFKSEFNIVGATEEPTFPAPFLLFNRDDIA